MKRKALKILAVSLISALTISIFAGCSRKEQQKKIGMVVSTLNNPFFVSMKDGAEKRANELGYKLIVLDSQNDPAKERANVEDLIELGVITLLINPTDSDAVSTSIKVANEKKVPVITLDRQANDGEVTSHIASDNIKGGNMAAEFALDKLKDKKDIKAIELQGVPGASATRDRGKGFNDIVNTNSSINIVSSQSADFDRQKGLQVMENIIQAIPEFDVVFAHNDEMALGAAKAIKTANKDVILIGFDGNADAEDAILKGDMTATVAQQPDVIGALGVDISERINKGEHVDKEIPASLKILTKSDLE
ncbi:ribose ABC transporter substrate-binding protein RbsB [Clostridium chauvoei]|uniref:Ribose ABC transporter substrate-binding protein RbsB n=2 Tax=Clostridium chauvoei TaxID=46867 RepID=A0ABD4RKB7_9CLOT|nr:ribose ABC transporter substrate-binding protein RbsB [Clostridium chauvoei]ATD54483.1 D-ribose ABC transporter substrate-binding protein RbsB [Clostridium chauvoei]ATD57834.1 D-ribose ABC transporter substrate-binding protein [Clostridium chauvoei]MBX7281650.1 ribose ABC transporter substrate-binding protein RbsB [Clostridium chauvoei]MBX7284170.1 ribose ABC transporter substrate-binding protein RbsB [Clostridium chauvoei]MBX7286698.1 ribose ABC transporter substrate-binding protein RbsB [